MEVTEVHVVCLVDEVRGRLVLGYNDNFTVPFPPPPTLLDRCGPVKSDIFKEILARFSALAYMLHSTRKAGKEKDKDGGSNADSKDFKDLKVFNSSVEERGVYWYYMVRFQGWGGGGEWGLFSRKWRFRLLVV